VNFGLWYEPSVQQMRFISYVPVPDTNLGKATSTRTCSTISLLGMQIPLLRIHFVCSI
jgi:hypothetical protein